MEPRDLHDAFVRQGVERVCEWMIRGEWRRYGQEYCIGSLAGEEGRSLKVHLTGGKAGVWSDFNGGAAGDFLDLLRHARGYTIREAILEAKEYLGVKDYQFEKAGAAPKKTYKRPDPAKLKPLTVKSPVTAYLTDQRKLTPEAIKAYRIGQEDIGGGKWAITFPFVNGAGTLVNIKHLALERVDGKKKSWQESGAEPCLWGWHAIDPNLRTITVCEGEIDAVSLWQYGFPALSVPAGAGVGAKHAWIEHDWQELERFDNIFLCFDNESEPDKQRMIKDTIAEVSSRLGRHRCFVVKMPEHCKDPNEAIQKCVPAERIRRAYEEAQPTQPDQLKFVGEFYDEVIDVFYPAGEYGMVIPWGETEVNGKQPRRVKFNPGEVTLVTGHAGHGKSEVIRNILLKAALAGERICMASLEEKPQKYIARMVRMVCGKRLPERSEIAQAIEWLNEWVLIVNAEGEIKLDPLLDIFRYAAKRYACRWFDLDSLMCLDDVNEEDLDGQKKAIQKMAAFTGDTNTHLFLIAHPNKASGEDVPAGMLAVSGSAKLSQRSHKVMAVWRNKKKELGGVPDCEPDTVITISKDREEGVLARYHVWFDPGALQYREENGQVAPMLPSMQRASSRSTGGGYVAEPEEEPDEWALNR